MGFGREANSYSKTSNSPMKKDCRRSQLENMENLNLLRQPLKTLKYFLLAMIDYFRLVFLYLFTKGRLILFSSFIVGALSYFLVAVDGPHAKHLEEVSNYLTFGLWWISLGVASSIGFGYGFHTFVLYLGPHVAFFTIKAMQCGRIDLKSAPYDTIQLKRGPSWLDKSCHEFGPSNGVEVSLTTILLQVQIEAILWGAGTALGELPPYFLSRAAHLAGSSYNAMEELDGSEDISGRSVSSFFSWIKRLFRSLFQHLNFFTILILASVPNPLFDLAGIMCGQFGTPFWEFFGATLIGKAIIKTHIQTIFVILICNNQLLNWLENEFIWIVSFIPGLASVVPKVVTNLLALREKYMSSEPSNVEVKNWNIAAIWNYVVWLMLIIFIAQCVTSTAQQYYLKQKQEELGEEEVNGDAILSKSD